MTPSSLYINLLKKCLINEIYIENEVKLLYLVHCLFGKQDVQLGGLVDPDLIPQPFFREVEKAKNIGDTVVLQIRNERGELAPAHHIRNYVEFPHSMIGRKRMDNLQFCIETILEENIPGDFIETGVWRGGATIFMRAMLAVHGVNNRTVWVADSFDGVPPPTHPQDRGITLDKSGLPVLAVSLDKVKNLFSRYDMLDGQVQFLQGWFKDTLPTAPIQQLSLLRLDGDLYESTMDALNALYAKLAVGGFVIVDDYTAVSACKQAIHDFRRREGVASEMIVVDPACVYWRKTG
jgi:O-methyltransferase